MALLGMHIGATAQQIDASKDPGIDPAIRPFLKELNAAGKNATPLWLLPGKGPSEGLTGLQNKTQVDMSGVDITQRTITEDGVEVPIYIVRPSGAQDILPVIMFFHGGVWIAGNFENHKRLVRDLVVNTKSVGVFVDYTFIREAKFPTQINQAYAATKWVAEHGSEIQADGSRIALAGNSVGGNMTAAVALMARDKGAPAIRFQALLYPALDANFETPSYKAFANDRFLSRAFMQYGWSMYAPDAATRKERYAAPLQATIEQLKGVAPALIQTAENDPLRDEGEAYGRKLREAGVECITVRYNSMIHDFQLLNALNQLPAVQASLRQLYTELTLHLQ